MAMMVRRPVRLRLRSEGIFEFQFSCVGWGEFMHGTISKRASEACEIVRPDGRDTDQLVGSVLADIAYTLWPEGTAPSLAAAVKCEVRTAERYLGGQREWSGDAIAAVVSEILKRHAMRNVRVKARS